MNILLTGASGFIGRNIAAVLSDAGHRIKPASRRNGFDFRRMQSPSDWLPHLDGVDAVINCVGIIGESRVQRFAVLHARAPCALFRACKQCGVRRVLQISALGTDDTAFSAYHLSKRMADDCLRNLELDWFVLRPSLIYGRGGGSARLFMRLAALPLIPVIGDGQQLLQPVHISDVVATVVRSLDSPDVRQTLDVVGAETVTFADWLQSMRQAQGLSSAPLLHLPFPLTLALSHIARHFSPMLQPENLRMLQSGYWADHHALERFLGRKPIAPERHLFFSDVITPWSTS